MTVTVSAVGSLRDIAAADWDALAGDSPWLSHFIVRAGRQRRGGRAQWLAAGASGAVARRPIAGRRAALPENPFARRICVRLGLGARLRPAWPALLPQATVRRAVFADSWPALVWLAMRPARGLCAGAGGFEQDGVSGCHVLFAQQADRAALLTPVLLCGWACSFIGLTRAGGLCRFSGGAAPGQAAAKNPPERNKVARAGVTVRTLVGREIGEADWAFFERCYRHTYHAHGGEPHLPLSFFAVGRAPAAMLRCSSPSATARRLPPACA